MNITPYHLIDMCCVRHEHQKPIKVRVQKKRYRLTQRSCGQRRAQGLSRVDFLTFTSYISQRKMNRKSLFFIFYQILQGVYTSNLFETCFMVANDDLKSKTTHFSGFYTQTISRPKILNLPIVRRNSHSHFKYIKLYIGTVVSLCSHKKSFFFLLNSNESSIVIFCFFSSNNFA